MNSSVVSRNNQLALLDDKFEEFFDTYDDKTVGGLDCQEIKGSRPENSDVMNQILYNIIQHVIELVLHGNSKRG